MAQHRRANSSGQDSAVHLHLKEKNHSYEDNSAHMLAREDRWFERVVKEYIYFKLNHLHLGSPTPSSPHKGWLGQQPTSGPNNSETQTSHMSLMTL